MEEDTYESTPCRGVKQNPIKIPNCAQERGYPEPMGRQVDVVKPSGRCGHSRETCDQQKNNCHGYVNILRAEEDCPVHDHRNAQDLGKVGAVPAPRKSEKDPFHPSKSNRFRRIFTELSTTKYCIHNYCLFFYHSDWSQKLCQPRWSVLCAAMGKLAVGISEIRRTSCRPSGWTGSSFQHWNKFRYSGFFYDALGDHVRDQFKLYSSLPCGNFDIEQFGRVFCPCIVVIIDFGE
jgi:hypothetical protein